MAYHQLLEVREPCHGEFHVKIRLPRTPDYPVTLTIYVHEVYVRDELVRVIAGGKELELAIPNPLARVGLYKEIESVLQGVEVACPRIFGPEIAP